MYIYHKTKEKKNEMEKNLGKEKRNIKVQPTIERQEKYKKKKAIILHYNYIFYVGCWNIVYYVLYMLCILYLY